MAERSRDGSRGRARTIAAALAALLSLAVPPPANAAIKLDLSYVDTGSPAYRRFRDWVDAAVAGRPGYGFSPADAVYLYRISGKQHYCEFAVGEIDRQVAAAEAAIAAGERPAVAGDSYLEAGPMIGALALGYEVCAAFTGEAQRARWRAYAERTLANIWDPPAARWGDRAYPWSGWGTDNPGNNYHYSFLEATMSWALAADDAAWLARLRQRLLPALTAYVAALPGGGSREGTGYGTAQMRLFALYRLWRDSTGEDLAAANGHLDDTIRFWVHATVPDFTQFAPLGDQARVSQPEIYDYQRRLMLEARALTRDAAVRDLASWWLSKIPLQRMTHGFNARYDLLPAGSGGHAPAERDYVASGTGRVFARTGWNRDATWLAFTAGPYSESHAHQDQGGFMLYRGGWLAVTENIWTRSGIQQGTEVHNVLRFERDGAVLPQREGTTSTMKVEHAPDGALIIRADLAPAYGGGSAVRAWTRELRFAADGRLQVVDRYAVAAGTRAVFQLDVPQQPVVDGREARAGALRLRVLSPESARLGVHDWRSTDAGEFRSGWRIDVETGAAEAGSGEFRVEIDGGG
jgi:hypothetical protein